MAVGDFLEGSLKFRMRLVGWTEDEIAGVQPKVYVQRNIASACINVSFRIGRKAHNLQVTDSFMENKRTASDMLDAVAGIDMLRNEMYLYRLDQLLPGKFESVRASRDGFITVTLKSGRTLETNAQEIDSKEFLATCILME
jgi:hypothetical protein